MQDQHHNDNAREFFSVGGKISLNQKLLFWSQIKVTSVTHLLCQSLSHYICLSHLNLGLKFPNPCSVDIFKSVTHLLLICSLKFQYLEGYQSMES